jgi:hypothetical protein
MPPQLPPLPRPLHDGQLHQRRRPSQQKKQKTILISCSLRTLHMWHLLHTGGSVRFTWWAPGYSEPLSAHPYFPQPVPSTMFSSTLFPSNMFASSTVPSVYFPQPASLNLLACISLSPLPQHLTTSESLRSTELTRIYAYYLSSHPCYVMGPKSIDSFPFLFLR